MHTRPASLLVSVVIVAVTGLAALLVAAMLGFVAAGAIPILDGGVTPFAWLVAGSAAAFGVAGAVAAVGLWQRHGWAWPLAVGVQLTGTLGALAAVASSGPQVPVVIGTALVVAGLGALVAPDTRRSVAV